jgi:hypothetical protein
MNTEIPVFKPTKNNEENYYNLTAWAETVGKMLDDDTIRFAGENVYYAMDEMADREIAKHHDLGTSAYFQALYAKNNPAPYEYSEKYHSDVYDKKRKLFNSGRKQYQLDLAQWEKDRAKFVNTQWGIWYGQVNDNIKQELKNHGIDGYPYGIV